MTDVVHFQRAKMTFEPGTTAIGSGDGPGRSGYYARLIGPKLSKSMGAGIAMYDQCTIEWTLLYDEIIVVLEGLFRMRYGKDLEHVIEASPGDVIWLANGTHLTYEGKDAKIFYAVDPVDWRSKNGYPE